MMRKLRRSPAEKACATDAIGTSSARMAQLAATEPDAVTVSFTFGLDLLLEGLDRLPRADGAQ